MWDLPGPGIEPVSPASAGGFLITVPPGKSLDEYFGPCTCFTYAFFLIKDHMHNLNTTSVIWEFNSFSVTLVNESGKIAYFNMAVYVKNNLNI